MGGPHKDKQLQLLHVFLAIQISMQIRLKLGGTDRSVNGAMMHCCQPARIKRPRDSVELADMLCAEGHNTTQHGMKTSQPSCRTHRTVAEHAEPFNCCLFVFFCFFYVFLCQLIFVYILFLYVN